MRKYIYNLNDVVFVARDKKEVAKQFANCVTDDKIEQKRIAKEVIKDIEKVGISLNNKSMYLGEAI